MIGFITQKIFEPYDAKILPVGSFAIWQAAGENRAAVKTGANAWRMSGDELVHEDHELPGFIALTPTAVLEVDRAYSAAEHD